MKHTEYFPSKMSVIRYFYETQNKMDITQMCT